MAELAVQLIEMELGTPNSSRTDGIFPERMGKPRKAHRWTHGNRQQGLLATTSLAPTIHLLGSMSGADSESGKEILDIHDDGNALSLSTRRRHRRKITERCPPPIVTPHQQEPALQA
jgi:hypothetical protein